MLVLARPAGNVLVSEYLRFSGRPNAAILPTTVRPPNIGGRYLRSGPLLTDLARCCIHRYFRRPAGVAGPFFAVVTCSIR